MFGLLAPRVDPLDMATSTLLLVMVVLKTVLVTSIVLRMRKRRRPQADASGLNPKWFSEPRRV